MGALRIYQASADALPPLALTDTHRLILRTIARAGGLGATDEEIRTATAVAGNTLRPRRIELTYAGLVRDSGSKRKSSAGRPVTVWVATPAGHQEAQRQ